MKKLILMVFLLTLVAFVSGAMAQQKPTPAPEKPAATVAPAPAKPAGTPAPARTERFGGVIDKVDEMAKAVTVKGKATVIMGGKVTKEDRTFTFAITDKTKIARAGKDLPFAELKKDMQVVVDYMKEGEKMIASAIRVGAPKPMPKKEQPAEAPKK